MSKNLMETLLDEIQRNGGLLERYESLGPAGRFGAMIIEADLAEAKRAVAENDIANMIVAVKKLEGNE